MNYEQSNTGHEGYPKYGIRDIRDIEVNYEIVKPENQ